MADLQQDNVLNTLSGDLELDSFLGNVVEIAIVTGTVFETYAFPDDWEYPEPEEWYPADA